MALNECTLPSQCLAYKATFHYNMRIDSTRRAGQSLCERCGSKDKAAVSRSRSDSERTSRASAQNRDALIAMRKNRLSRLPLLYRKLNTLRWLDPVNHQAPAYSCIPLLVDCSRTPPVILPLTAGPGLSDCKKSANSCDRSSMSVNMH